MRWHGPVESESEAIEAGRALGMDFPGAAIWVAPIDEETDDDGKFWDEVASGLLFELDSVVERMVEDGWLDPEEGWTPPQVDRDRILAEALRQVLGPRPEWRTVDTSKARRVEL